MLLSKLLNGVEVVEIKNMIDVDIEKITDKTNEVTDKSMFCCIVGEKIDSHTFVGDLTKRGCKVFLVEKFLNDVDSSIIQIKVKSVRKQMCIVISNFYENCHKKMDLIGVTGTNGKTSITFILKNAFEKLKCKVGIIGTTGCYMGNKKIETNLTTPD
ncbi:MAG: Mur ligase family protein, partial [Christensenellales bacterium]